MYSLILLFIYFLWWHKWIFLNVLNLFLKERLAKENVNLNIRMKKKIINELIRLRLFFGPRRDINSSKQIRKYKLLKICHSSSYSMNNIYPLLLIVLFHRFQFHLSLLTNYHPINLIKKENKILRDIQVTVFVLFIFLFLNKIEILL